MMLSPNQIDQKGTQKIYQFWIKLVDILDSFRAVLLAKSIILHFNQMFVFYYKSIFNNIRSWTICNAAAVVARYQNMLARQIRDHRDNKRIFPH